MENMNGQNFGVVEGQFDSVQQSDAAVASVTSFADLQRYARGTVVQLPDFAEGQPFIARMRRPSMLSLVKIGKIPNKLLVTANELFNGKQADTDDENVLGNMFDVMEVICEVALIEPTYEEIKKAGLELSDNQIMAIFNYTQVGVDALENFRS